MTHAIYPHLDTVPHEVWRDLFPLRQEIDVLADDRVPSGRDGAVLAALVESAQAGATVRICLTRPDASLVGEADHVAGEGMRAAISGEVAVPELLLMRS